MSELTLPPNLTEAALDELRRAKAMLEAGSALGRALALPAKWLASGTASMGRLLPAQFREGLEEASMAALRAACAAATWNAAIGPQRRGSLALAAALGGVGGAGGLPGALVELPVTTTLILRRIAQIAAEEGEDIALEATRAECVSVFAFGGPMAETPMADGTTDSAYYATRVGLARMIDGAARTGIRAILPAVLRPVAARFAAVAEAKLAAQAVPILGALSGAAINAAFIAHFERRARGHFMVRRLERQYGAAAIRQAYLTQD